MRLLTLVLSSAILSSMAGCGPVDDEPLADPGGVALLFSPPGRTYLLTLAAGAFPPTSDHPSALAYLPSGFDPTPPLSIVVYLHGFENCVENIVRPTGEAQACTPGGPVRIAHNLIAQLEASGKNAMLLCPEVAFDRSSSDPGKLGTTDGFRALLTETLTKLRPVLGTIDLSKPGQLGPVALASHSGGYAAAAAMATRGGVPISELYLLDSLYGYSTDFENFIRKDLAGLSGSTPRRRFATVYTDGGGTLSKSQALADRAKTIVPDRSVIVDDRTTATWPTPVYAHGLLFKRSMLSHSGVARYYFGTLVATSSLPLLRAPLWPLESAAEE